MKKSNEDVANDLIVNKKAIDHAYRVTKEKYNYLTANEAIRRYFLEYRIKGFTRDQDARKKMDELQYKPYSLIHILLDYAISSFLLNNMESDISEQDLYAYARDTEGSLDYTPEVIVKVFAIGVAVSPYWAYNLLCCNPQLKEALVKSFLEERFIKGLGDSLDETKAKLIKLIGTETPILMSKSSLNNDIRNMINDDEELYIGSR